VTARRGHGEGSIYRRTDGRWAGVIDLGWINGKRSRKYVYGKTRADVASRLRIAQSSVASGLPIGPERLTVADCLDAWLDAIEGSVGVGTLDTYGRVVRLYLKPHVGRKRLAKLSPADVSTMLRSMEHSGLAAETRRLTRAVLRRALRRAEQDGLVARNVAAIADGPRVPKKEGRTLTPKQAKMLLATFNRDRLGPAFTLALSCGLRRGEVLGLSWDNIDLEARRVHVVQQLLRVPAERTSDDRSRGRTTLIIAGVKTAGSRRTLHLPQPVCDILRNWRTVQTAERLKLGPAWQDDKRLVFTTPIGTPVDPDNYRHALSRLSKAAGLGHWHPHELRHSAASLMLAMNVPLEVVSETLGHSSIRVTKDVYGHLLTPAREAAADAMSRALWM
jgi:integrase